MSGQSRRFVAAAVVVVAVVAAVWLFGRPEPQPMVQVVAAAEDWPARREPGAFVTVEMPEASAQMFVTSEQLADRIPAVPVPAGAVVSEALLTHEGAAVPEDLSATLLALTVDASLWPDPGPAVGDAAVLAAQAGGCASAVLPIVGTGESVVVVEARPELAAVLGPQVWWIWESPPAGWPGCSVQQALPEEQALPDEQMQPEEPEE